MEFGQTNGDGDDGVDSELPSEVDHRVRSEDVNRLKAEIDGETLTVSPALVLTSPRGRVFDEGHDGGGDGTGMGGNVQWEGKEFANTSDSICIICLFVKIGFPKGKPSFEAIESF